MAVHYDKPGARLHLTKTLKPAAAETQPSDEALWQQFFHHLRQQKPRLGVCLDNLIHNGFLAKWERMQ